MENLQYNLQFDKLCDLLNIGNLICEPKQLTGGLLHRMYAIETTSGKYAIKTLNPQVMLRPMAKSNILNGEKIAAFAAQFIPALLAKQFGGTIIVEIDGQYYLIYDWMQGKSLFGNSITPLHCEQIGELLGKLHTIDFSPLNIKKPDVVEEKLVDWNGYLFKGQQVALPWVDEFSLNLKNLYDWNRRYLVSIKYLEEPSIIGHGDIDPKNVMWQENHPIIIDWESAGYLNPAHEFIIYALYWSDSNDKIDKEKFIAFLKGYLRITPLIKVDWNIVMDAGLSPHWLEYSLKRSLGIESADAEERQMGTDHVFETINYMKRYESSSNQIVDWLTSNI